MTTSQGTDPRPEPPPVPEAVVTPQEPDQDQALPPNAGFGEVVDAMLKRPATVIDRFKEGHFGGISIRLMIIALAAMTVYSLVVASFSGQEQWMYAPAKCVGGLVITMLICLPSLHIFACLSGADIRFGASASMMLKAITLSAILLTGFAPVSWVFSQSTSSVYVMGIFHLTFWTISMIFGMKVLLKGIIRFRGGQKGFMRCWIIIFFITSLQMMTALRPIIGRSPDVLPKEKKFFLEHWIENAASNNKAAIVPEKERNYTDEMERTDAF